MSREFLLIVQESAWKTAVATPVIWSQSTAFGLSNYQGMYLRLDGGNAFAMRPRPVQAEVPYGGGIAVGAYRVSDKQEIRGNLTTKLCVGQSPMLLSWGLQRVTAAGAPWTTTEIVGDLASCSIYHAYQRFDGSYKRRLYRGVKVDSVNLTISEASTVGTLQLGLSAADAQGNQFDASTDPTSTVFPAPLDNQLPIDPYLFSGTCGAFTYAGSARTHFSELTFNSANTLARRFYCSRYVQLLRWMGRKTTLATRLLYEMPPDDRTTYEGIVPEPVSVQLLGGGATPHGFTLSLNGQNVLDPLDEDLPLDDLYFQSSTENNLWDSAAQADITLTFA